MADKEYKHKLKGITNEEFQKKVKNEAKELRDNNPEFRKQEAKRFMDFETLEKHLNKLPRNDEGYLQAN